MVLYVVHKYLSLFLEGIGQVAVSIRKVRLKLNGSFISINSQLYQPVGKDRLRKKEKRRNGNGATIINAGRERMGEGDQVTINTLRNACSPMKHTHTSQCYQTMTLN